MYSVVKIKVRKKGSQNGQNKRYMLSIIYETGQHLGKLC